MRTDAVLVAVAVCIVAVTLASGPPGLVSVGEPDDRFADAGTGNATVGILDAPETVTIHAEGQDTYRLAVPSTTIEVSTLRGNPLLRYSLSLETREVTTTHPLADRGEGVHEITIDTDPVFEADHSHVESATLTLVLVTETGDRTLLERSVGVVHD